MEPRIQKGKVFADDRGTVRFVNGFDPSTAGVRRFYQVQNIRSGYIRAFHGHRKERKFVYVPVGAALVVAVSLEDFDNITGYLEMRRTEGKPCLESDPEYLEEICMQFQKDWGGEMVHFHVLSSEYPSVLEIPEGYYNGFKSLTGGTIVQFFSTSTVEESQGDDIRQPWDALGVKHVWEEDFR